MSAPLNCDRVHRDIVIVEIPEVYDGGLYFECGLCGHRWHRWDEGHPLHAKAEPYVSAGAVRGTT